MKFQVFWSPSKYQFSVKKDKSLLFVIGILLLHERFDLLDLRQGGLAWTHLTVIIMVRTPRENSCQIMQGCLFSKHKTWIVFYICDGKLLGILTEHSTIF